MVATMRRWEMDGLGRDRLTLKEVPAPQPGPGEVLVKVAAAALNYRDKLVIEGGMGLDARLSLHTGLRSRRHSNGAGRGGRALRTRGARHLDLRARLDRRPAAG